MAVFSSVEAQAPQPAPAGDVVGVGNFAHIVADLDKSLEFYRDRLGLPVAFAAGEFAFLDAGGTTLALRGVARLPSSNSRYLPVLLRHYPPYML